MQTDRMLPGWLVACGIIVALACAVIAGTDAAAQPTPDPDPTATASASAPSPDAPPPSPEPEPTAAASADPSSDRAHPPAPSPRDHGRYPLHENAMVPLKWMPPGSHASPIPSDEIFPPQTITLRFNHKKHIKEYKQTCKVCHAAAFNSTDSKDKLMPDPAQTCDNCHDVDHSNLARVESGGDQNGACDFCHIGDDAGKGGQVARMVIPHPNLRFPHKKHLDRNIDCAQCHGMIEELELATREQLPRMAGCFACHAMPAPSAGEARGDCSGCHLTDPSGRLQTEFSTGELMPPNWLHAAQHTPDWLARHKGVAGANSEMCNSCHSESFCSDCHDGRIRPRDVHPNDWLSMHAQEARMDSPSCTSCHQLQSFCADCHRRVGVARESGSAAREGGRRFHPPPQVWSTGPRSPRHHSWEAERNLNACVSCHSERDCATCHASKGLRGGAGIDPHPTGFESRCQTAFSRNPRPCLVCHQSNDPVLARCQ